MTFLINIFTNLFAAPTGGGPTPPAGITADTTLYTADTTLITADNG